VEFGNGRRNFPKHMEQNKKFIEKFGQDVQDIQSLDTLSYGIGLQILKRMIFWISTYPLRGTECRVFFK
jgi:hypothetical protein